MSDTVCLWLKGLASAVIGGAANSITVMVAAPDQFNLADGWKKLLSVCVVSMIVSAAMYLKSSPLPTTPPAVPPAS